MKTKKTIFICIVVIFLVSIHIPVKAELLEKNPVNDVELTITTDKVTYFWAVEPVDVTLTLKNSGDEDITLSFRSGLEFDFVIYSARLNRYIYQWSYGKYFTLSGRNLTIPAGGSYSWNDTWNQEGHLIQWRFHHKVLPGSYLIFGWVAPMKVMYYNTTFVRTTLFSRYLDPN